MVHVCCFSWQLWGLNHFRQFNKFNLPTPTRNHTKKSSQHQDSVWFLYTLEVGEKNNFQGRLNQFLLLEKCKAWWLMLVGHMFFWWKATLIHSTRTIWNKTSLSFKETYTSWWFQPIWKILVKFPNLPQIGVKINNIWNHHPVYPPPWSLHILEKIGRPAIGEVTWHCGMDFMDNYPRAAVSSLESWRKRSEMGYVRPNHQTFQVPKMEGFLNLMFGYLGDEFSLTYSLYRWLPPF